MTIFDGQIIYDWQLNRKATVTLSCYVCRRTQVYKDLAHPPIYLDKNTDWSSYDGLAVCSDHCKSPIRQKGGEHE